MFRLAKKYAVFALCVLVLVGLAGCVPAVRSGAAYAAPLYGSEERADLPWYYGAEYLDIPTAVAAVGEWFGQGGDFSSAKDDPVVIAVIDTGINASHEIFGGEKYGDVLLRDGSGGVIGYNSAAESRNYADDSSDGHGTHVAGIVASLIHAFGLEEYVKIMPVKASYKKWNGQSSFDYEDVEKAVDFALANGADIVNMSLAADSPSWEDVIAADDTERAVFVAAAGNHSGLFQNGYDSDKKKFYPAACENVIGVMNYEAVDGGISLKSSSNYGSAYDVCAPGTDIMSADAATVDGYKTLSGTSMASPFVAFAAGLLQLRFAVDGDPSSRPDAESVRNAFSVHYTASLTYKGGDYGLLDMVSLASCRFAYGEEGEVFPVPDSVEIAREKGGKDDEYVFTALSESPVLWDGFKYEWIFTADGEATELYGKSVAFDFASFNGDIEVVLNVCVGDVRIATAVRLYETAQPTDFAVPHDYGKGLVTVIALWISVGAVVALTVIACRIIAASK